MANITLNPIMGRIRGAIGDLVFRGYFGRTVLARMPNRDGYVQSPAQLAVVNRFKLAAVYGASVFASPLLKAVYTAAGKARGTSAFALAVADYLKPPLVSVVDVSGYAGQVGNLIAVEATDDFEVVGVTVALKDGADQVIEQGPALLLDGRWQYAATVAVGPGETVNVEATAKDRPGHTGKLAVVVVLP